MKVYGSRDSRKTRYGELIPVQVNGDDQWIHVQGAATGKPIILFLHGGPGFSQMPFSPILHARLSRDFTVVNWDQRASGKSYSSRQDYTALKLETYVEDATAVTERILEDGRQDRLCLIGHSWGCILGMNVLRKSPELYCAFAGTGFGVDFNEGERESVEYLLGKAREDENERAIEELGKIRFPIQEADFDEYIKLKSHYMNKYGGYFYRNPREIIRENLRAFLFSGIYSPKDYVKLLRGSRVGREVGKRLLLSANLIEQVPESSVPVHFLVGRHDHHTSHIKAREYFEKLVAPRKTWTWFEESAHSPLFEENEKFCTTVTRLIQ